MGKKKTGQSASDMLQGVVSKGASDYISFREIKHALHERGFGLLMLVFAVPLSVPLPVPPGLTAIPAIPLLFFAVQMIMGMDSPWLPKWLGKKKIKRTTLAFMVEKAAPYLKKIEKLLRHRLPFASSPGGEKIVGIFAMIFATSILIPLPFTNFIPALGIVFMSLGLLSKDGVVIILGKIIGVIGVSITTSIILLGHKAVEGMISALLPGF